MFNQLHSTSMLMQIVHLIGARIYYLTIRLFALDFYRVIVDEGATSRSEL